MKLPNKLFTVNESCIGKFPLVLSILQEENLSLIKLYEATKSSFDSASDFVETLDSLFFLGKITFNEKSEVISYVK